MRRWLLGAVFVLAIPTLGTASPVCAADTLANYIALGAGGCTIGGATVSGFGAAASLAGGNTIAAAQINVTPSDLALGPQLDFGLTGSAGPGELFGVLINYSLGGLPVVGSNLSMTGSAAGPAVDPLDTGGVVTAIQDLCLSGNFAPFPTCTGTPASLLVVHDEIGAFPVDTRLFAPSSFFDVFVDITIDGGTGGTASLDGSVTNQFVRDQAAAVPEPSAMLLVGSGLFGLWARRRRRVPTR